MKETVPKSLPIIEDTPHQPKRSFQFPRRDFSGRIRGFMHEWFTKFSWLHYDEAEDRAYCFLCVKCLKENMFANKSSAKSADAFTYDGFNSWNKAIERFKLHEDSKEHKDAKFLIIVSSSG